MKACFFEAQRVFSIDGAEAIEKQLADISQSDGVTARDVLQGDLLDEISEKAIDRGSIAEVADAGEEFGGGGFASALGLQAALSVVDAGQRS